MPTGLAPVGGLPKDLGQIVVPPLQSLTHDADWLDSLPGRGFHGGVLDELAAYYELRRRATIASAPAGAGGTTSAQRGGLLPEALGRGRRPSRTDLDGGQRLQVLDTLIAVLGGAYAHLPAKRAAYAIDPVQALQLLRRRARRPDRRRVPPRRHRRSSPGCATRTPATSGRRRCADQVAVLPFLVEQYGPDADPRYLVSKIAPRRSTERDRRVRAGRASSSGGTASRSPAPSRSTPTGRPAAGPTRGAPGRWSRSPSGRSTTARRRTSTGSSRLPHRARAGSARSGCPWRVLEPGKAATACSAGSRGAPQGRRRPRRRGRPARQEAAVRARRCGPRDRRASAPAADRPGRATASAQWLDTPLQDVLAAQRAEPRTSATCGSGRFDVDDDDAFVAEVIRLLGLLPQTGLIVDLRGNPGGLIWAAERLLQLFTDRPTDRADPVLPRRDAADPGRWPTARSTGSSWRPGRRRWRTPSPPASCTRSRCRSPTRLVQRPRPALPRPGRRGRRREHLLLRRPVRRRLGRQRHRPAGQRRPGDRRRRGQRLDRRPAARRAGRHRPRARRRCPAESGFTLADPPGDPLGRRRRHPDRGPRHRRASPTTMTRDDLLRRQQRPAAFCTDAGQS